MGFGNIFQKFGLDLVIIKSQRVHLDILYFSIKFLIKSIYIIIFLNISTNINLPIAGEIKIDLAFLQKGRSLSLDEKLQHSLLFVVGDSHVHGLGLVGDKGQGFGVALFTKHQPGVGGHKRIAILVRMSEDRLGQEPASLVDHIINLEQSENGEALELLERVVLL